MIKNRELALNLAKRWGNVKDIEFLRDKYKRLEIDGKDFEKVFMYWIERQKKAMEKFDRGEIAIGKEIKNWFMIEKILKKYFG